MQTADLTPDTRALGDWFARQPAAFQRALLGNTQRRVIEAGAWLYGAGEDAGGLFAVLTGSVRVYAVPPKGTPVLIDLAGPGTWFGQVGLVARSRRMVTAMAAERTELLTASRGAIQNLVRQRAEFWEPFAELSSEQMRRLLRVHAEVLRHGPKARVAARLVTLSQRGRFNRLTLTQADLGEMVGLERKTVHRVLAELKASGLVDMGYGFIEVRDRAGLARIE